MKKQPKVKDIYCEVPVSYLLGLYELSEKCRKDQQKWFETDKPLMPTSFSQLIGFSSVAIEFAKHNKIK